MRRQNPTTIAILGTDSLAEDILARLLRAEGFDVTLLEAHPTALMDELLDGVDVLLVVPGLGGVAREAFLKATRNSPGAAAIPVLPLTSALGVALLDELSASASWCSLFEELVAQIGTALERAAASARALLVAGCARETSPAAGAARAP